MNNELYEVRVRKFKNTNKFRQAAIHFNNYGYYTAAPPGTTEYKKYWDEEMKRCKYGFTAEDGDTITGYHYFYLNYCPIMKVVKKEVPDKKGGTRTVYSKEQSLPDFWDYDKEFFDAVDEAEYVGSHAAVIKKRRSGYSFKVASMLNRNFFLIPGSVSYAIASEAEFLTKDGVLSKAWQMMSFIDDHTAWTKKRQVHDTKMHKRASFITTKEGTQVEKGYKSEIIGITLKNDPQKARGKSGKLIVWEESGKFPGLLDAWQIARPSVEQDGHAYGTMIAFGTGGTEEGDYGSLKELFYHPAGYNILPINNVWDEGAEGTPCGFFVPNYMNMQDLMDEEGNSMIKEAMEKTNEERRKVEQNSGDKNAIDRHIAEHPNCLHGSTWVSNEGIQKNVYNERIKNIDNKFENGFQDLYKLTTENNRELICTETHHIYDGTNYRPLSDYEEGDKIELLPTKFSHSYQYVNINYGIGNINFDLKIDEDWAKFIGLFMGDGSFYSRRYANDLEFSLDKKDLNTLNWLESFIYEKDFGACNIEEIGGMVRLRVSNRKLLDLFIHLGLIQRATEKSSWKRKVHVPEYIMKSPERVVASFLSGLYDSDGSISKDQGSISFYTKYEQFAKDIMLLLSGFDIYPKYKKSEYINSNGRKYIGRRLTIRKSNNNSFYRNIGFISKRKQDILSDNKSSKYKQWNFDYIKSIEYWGKDEVYNLETETKYYSANGIHTHNSPMEATLQLAGNIFPKKELQDQLAKIQTDKKLYNYKQVGDLKYGPDGRMKWIQTTDSKDVTKFPLDKNDDKHGAVVIWEHPVEDPPYGLYIAGCDPYDHDESTTSSLGSTFIYKRFQSFEEYYDIIVAEYTGRPESAEEYYENVLKLLKYYNARLLYENERKGLYAHFAIKGYDYMLANQPDIISDIISSSKVQRKKGIHMTKAIKDWGEREIRDWLNEEYAPGHKNLQKIMSIPLLQELISYNDKGNFDRVIALMMVMLYKKELHNVHVKEKKKTTKVDSFFRKRFFTDDRKFNFNRLR